jgi:gliding motility-associated protein GldM
MIAPINSKGADLRMRIDEYRSFSQQFIGDSIKKNNIKKVLATASFKEKNTIGAEKSWEERQFDNMPAIAAITILTKLQNDLRYVEGEVLNSLIANVDAGDIRVNQVEAFVIPESRIVMSGSNYKANIVLAAVDTTQRPLVVIGDKPLDNDRGIYEFGTGRAGTYDYSGYIEVPHGDGRVTKHEFASSYNVIEPMASVSATMVNVLYAGINNPISIAVPGVPNNDINATITNGTITRSGNNWIARPAKVGTNCVITVTANMNGRAQTVAKTDFRVRKLPDPTPFIAYKDAKGNPERYKGG